MIVIIKEIEVVYPWHNTAKEKDVWDVISEELGSSLNVWYSVFVGIFNVYYVIKCVKTDNILAKILYK